MDDAQSPTTRVLWSGGGAPDLSGVQTSRLTLVVESSLETAETLAREAEFAAVVVDGSDPEAALAVLQAAAENPNVSRRLAASTYADLPELVRAMQPGIVEHVLAKPVGAAQLLEALTDADPTASVIRYRALNAPTELDDAAVDRQLESLVVRLVELPATVIRPLVANDPHPRLQLVISVSDPFQDLRRELPAVLGWPLKATGSAMGSAYRSHPLRRLLGNLSEAQEVYCLGRDGFGYVALFPWHDEQKVTVVIGFAEPDPDRIAGLHTHAVAHARAFPLPTPHRHSPEVFYDPDYDWVITKGYVGPDRRRTSTSFINRYTFRGRRKALMPNEFGDVGSFVDVAPRWAWIMAAVFAVLFVVDTAMTAYFVGGGEVGELNPVMGWALDRSPALFWALKTALVVAVTFVVVRWHLWRPSRWLFAGSIAIYAALDAYWVFLVATHAIG